METRNNGEPMSRRIQSLLESYAEGTGTNFIDDTNLPVRDTIHEILNSLLEIMYPGYTGKRLITRENALYILGDLLWNTGKALQEQITRAFLHQCRLKNCPHCNCTLFAYEASETFLDSLVEIRGCLKEDVQAAYDGDPAAKSLEEIVISYPGILAITIHRLAHQLYLQEVPLIPRIMSEIAHSMTGIDIHPGASIGCSFFIDHGTGVVIGETTIIGDRVKIYQGVTLGALSFPLDNQGRPIKGGKRHPTIENDVTIYAEATILGNVTIGKKAVIGGNVWIKNDVKPGSVVSLSKPAASRPASLK